jgi:diaminopimelate epimerase
MHALPHLSNQSISAPERVNFVKYHANANDFIIIEGGSLVSSIKEQIDLLVKRAVLWCDRHRGIGADGILLVNVKDHLELTVINADGSIAANCGNGLRCVAKWWNKLSGQTSFVISLGSGLYQCTVSGDALNIEMGECHVERLADQQFPSLRVDARVFKANVANQHLLFLSSDEADPAQLINEIKKVYLDWADFNIGLILGARQHSIVYERGVGFTESCGSGAMAAAAALHLNGQRETQIKICQPGGSLLISLEELTNDVGHATFKVAQSGSASEVYYGIIVLCSP